MPTATALSARSLLRHRSFVIRHWSFVIAALAAAAAPSALAQPTAHQAAITAEALRPNGDPAGRALPLASRWNAHNFNDKQSWPTDRPGNRVLYPFPLSRVLDEIEAGQPIAPFFSWPRDANWSEALPNLYTSVTRLAATGMPFEVLGSNLEDGLWNDPARYWHRPMAENPAHIRWDVRALTAAPAPVGATEIATTGWSANRAAFTDGQHIILSGHGRVYQLAGAVTADASGQALVRLRTPLLSPVATGETLALIERKLDYFSAATPATFAQIGADVVSTTFGTTDSIWQQLATRYPDPPLVQIVSNNEGGGKISASSATSSWHYQTRAAEFEASFSSPLEDNVPRLAYARGYAELFGAYLGGLKNQLPWGASTGTRIDSIGYNAFGVNFELGRWGGWREGMTPYQHADTYQWLTWDGAAPDFYTYDWNYATDEHVGSPHIGAMQAFAMLAPRAEAQVPDFQWQLALWDGGIKKRTTYARWGTFPPTATIGTLATAITTADTGLALLPIEGAEPDTLILRNGELISIDGHSDYRPARATALYDQISVTKGGVPIPTRLTSTQVGAIDQAPAHNFSPAGPAQTLAIVGGGNGLVSSGADSFHLLAQPVTGDFTWGARLFGLDDPSAGLPQFPIVEAPGQADFVDPAAVALQQATDALMAGGSAATRTGLMVRANSTAASRYVALLRTAAGQLELLARTTTTTTPSASGLASISVGSAPVSLRLERSANTYTARYALADGVWTTLGTVELDLGPSPLTGFAVTAGNSPSTRQLLYTVGQDITTDAQGRATVPLKVNDFSSGVVINGHHAPVAAGAAIRLHGIEDRYEGLSVMALWLSRPRVIREFNWGDFPGHIERHWSALLRATRRVWDDPHLTRFWRQGRLVVNPAYEAATGRKHPLWELTDDDREGRVGPWLDRWQRQDRFHQLDVALNPPYSAWPQRYDVAFDTSPTSTKSLIKVWAIAYELGQAPNREWLLVTQSPRRDRSQVAITVPGYGPVSVDVHRRGSFYLLREGSSTLTPVGQYPLRPGATLAVTPETAPPVFSPAPGAYETGLTVLASSPTPGATLRYTTDGSEPTESSPAFPADGLTLSRSTTVVVRAYAPGLVPAEATRATFTLIPPVADRPVSGPNRVINPGFEQTNFQNWNRQSAAQITEAPRGGTLHARVTGSPGGTWQTVNALLPGTTYRLTVWGRANTPEDLARLYVKRFDPLVPDDVVSAPFPVGAYGQRTLYFTTGATFGSAEIGVWKSDGTGHVDIDDFDLRVSEPSPSITPENLRAAGTPSLTQIDLSWRRVEGALSYTLRRSLTPGGPYATVATGLTATTYADTALTPGQTYFYTFTALTPDGETIASPEIAATPVPDVLVDNSDPGFTTDNPANWSTWNSGGGQVYTGGNYRVDNTSTADPDTRWARWTPTLPRAGAYQVFMAWPADNNRPTAAPVEIVHATGTATGQTVNQRLNNGVWMPLGTHAFPAGNNPATASVRILATSPGYTVADVVRFVYAPLAAPVGLTATVNNTGAIALRWTARPGNHTAYVLERKTGSTGTYAALATLPATATEHLDTTAAPYTPYTYRLRESAFSSLSAPGNEATATLTGLAAWKVEHFGAGASTALSAHESDPDADGLANLLEYALARDPLVPDSTPALTTSTSTSPLNLSVSFLRLRADLIYTVEASSTLAPESWEVIATDPGQVSETVPVVVSDPTPVSENPRRFLRLRVTPR